MQQGLRKPTIIWGDIETTGLRAEQDIILEVGFRATDWWGEEIARITVPVLTAGWRSRLAGNQFVWDMHKESGLIDDLERLEAQRQNDLYSRNSSAGKLVAWLAQFNDLGGHDGKFPFAGNSVRLDRAFLNLHMQPVDDWFSYRILDISSIREAMRVVNPSVFNGTPDAPASHRPQGDIDNSIALWQFMIDNFFFEDGISTEGE